MFGDVRACLEASAGAVEQGSKCSDSHRDEMLLQALLEKLLLPGLEFLQSLQGAAARRCPE